MSFVFFNFFLLSGICVGSSWFHGFIEFFCFMPLHHLRPEMDYNPAVPLFLTSGECHDTIMIQLQKFDDRMYLANNSCGPIKG